MIAAPVAFLNDADSPNVSSWTPGGGPFAFTTDKVYYVSLWVVDTDGVAPTPSATLVGAAQALTAITSVPFSSGTNASRLIVFRFTVATNFSDDIAFTFGDTCTEYAALGLAVSGAINTGTNGADSVVQSKTGTTTGGTTITCTFDSGLTAGNAVIFFAAIADVTAPTPDSGWTEEEDTGSGLTAAYRLGTDDNSPSATGGSSDYGIVAIEVASRPSAKPMFTSRPLRVWRRWG